MVGTAGYPADIANILNIIISPPLYAIVMQTGECAEPI